MLKPPVLLLNTLLIFALSGFLPAASAENIKQLTVNHYLQNAEAKGRKANNLINESSPYLLQHAYNPVNWYAWGEQAFEKAKKENKPIFLSIGYSTCHWCHVMARESFENKKIAALLNKYFVSIKVDREQRPDIDAVYMSATQLINGQGGWPMSVFLDHDLRPFHAATYYPPFSADGRLGLQEVLLKIHELWTEQPEVIDEVATSVTARITQMADDTIEGGTLASDINQLTMAQIAGSFDDETGGFSAAPKFPRPGIFAFLNRVSGMPSTTETGKAAVEDARNMMKLTLDMMADGGIYDQLAGGFHRYSVDANWQVPHFEKMLYSQALMVMAYNDYYRIDAQGPDGQEKYKKIIYQTLGFVKQEMRSPKGGYYSALDADSERIDKKGRKTGEHAEGAYYLWREAELKRLLTKDEFDFVKQYFHVREHGNIFSDPQEEFTDLNIFYIDEEYRGQALSKQQEKWLSSVKKKLNKIRHLRPRPHLDDKVITAWNGMLLSAFAQAAITFDDKSLLADAIQILEHARRNLYDGDSKKLYRQHREMNIDPKTSAAVRIEAILADYVWIIDGLLQVYQAGNDKQWLDWALALQKKQDVLFLDPATGAYFEATASDENLLFRSKSIFDSALPSANAIALSNLKRFAALSNVALSNKQSDKKAFSAQADKLVSSFATVINQNPAAAAMLLAIEIKD
ncbi:MAG: thioredoxin domain-containing protein [Gammaproteobacteria bacterium]